MINAQKLHQKFVRLGGMRHKLKNRMLAILPEIYKSGIWGKYAGSIEEYAGKFGDIAQTTVKKRLRLEENLGDLPCLKAAIEKVGVHKVAMLAKIATPETDQAFAENVLNMSKMAVQSLSKELRARRHEGNADDGCDFNRDCGHQNQEPLCKAVSITKKIELDEQSAFLFMKLKAKLGKNLSDKEFLKIMLKERAKQEFLPNDVIAVAKQSGVLSENLKSCKSITGDTFDLCSVRTPTINSGKISRYIPVNKKREVVAQTDGKCSYPNCNLPFEVFHHADRWSESRSHESIIPLCKIHHEFAHNSLIQNETLKTDEWRISVVKEPVVKISQADVLYQKYRRKTLASTAS